MRRSPVTFALAWATMAVLACGGEDSGHGVRPTPRESGELVLPPSANAPRVMREAEGPDTLEPGSIERFEIVNLDSFPFAESGAGGPGRDMNVDAITVAYRRHYAEVLESEGSAVEGRIDRQLQQEAERRTAEDRGFGDWNSMISALTPEQRARLVDQLNEANVDMARDLHGSADGRAPAGAALPGG